MTPDQVVLLARHVLETALWLGTPLLLVATVVSLSVNIIQVLTSLQETTISTVPRLVAVAVAAFLLTPWMIRHLMRFTIQLFSDFRPFVQ